MRLAALVLVTSLAACGWHDAGPPTEAVIVAVADPDGYGRFTKTTIETRSGLRVSRLGAWGEVGDTITVVIREREDLGAVIRSWDGVARDGTRW